MPATQIILVRHGEARAGVDHVIGGDKGCRGLTDVGRAQAAALRDRLARTGELRPDVVYSSTLPRAVETAAVVAEAFGPGTPVLRARDLCEQVPGVCDGLPYEEALARWAPAVDGPDEPLSPGGESARAFDGRVRAALQRLVREHHDQTVLVVSHGGFIGAACMYVVGAPGLAEVYPFRLVPANTSISIFSPFEGGPPWVLDRYNDAAHLTGIDAQDGRTVSVYVVFQAEVLDPEAYEAYKAAAEATVIAAGGRYIVRGGEVVTLEGDAPVGRTVVLEFPTLQAALDWYRSDDYAAARRLREGIARARVYVVDGVPSLTRADMRNARFANVDLSGARFRDVDLSNAKIVDAMLVNANVSGLIHGLCVNDVEVAPFVEAELDRRSPERVLLRDITDVAGMRDAWTLIEETWATTLERARRLPEEALHERVDEEWSFVETLRHLVFATDAWIIRTIHGEAHPYHPLGLPQSGFDDPAVTAIDTGVTPSLAEVLEARANRMAVVRAVVDGLTAPEMARRCEQNPALGYPLDTRHKVADCLDVVLDEEWSHHQYAVRDLAVLEARTR